MVTFGEQRPLWKAELVTVLRFTGIQGLCVSVKTPEGVRDQTMSKQGCINDTINHTFIPLKETHAAALSIENILFSTVRAKGRKQ